MPATDDGEPGSSDLSAVDFALLRSLVAGNEWLRSLLCTLARRGLKFESDDTARAAAVLEVLSTWPWYKTGQFLFDLMEWEDFMLDGPPPPVLATALDPRALGRLTEALRRVRAQLDGADPDVAAVPAATEPDWERVVAADPDESLPHISATQYLYQYVVLGVWQALTEAAAATTER
jgi:hypothetical protein